MKRSINWGKSRLAYLFIGFVFIGLTSSTVFSANDALEETLTWCENLAQEATQMAFEAQAVCDYPRASQAWSLADDAVCYIAEISREVQVTTNSQLAMKAYNVCNQVETAIANIVRAAQHIASNSPNPDDIHAAKFLVDLCECAKKTNNGSMLAFESSSNVAESTVVYSR